MRRALWFVVVSAFVVTAPRAIDAQSPPPDLVIRGTVLDAMRAPIPGAQVTAASGGAATAVSAITDQRGLFTLPLTAGHTIVPC